MRSDEHHVLLAERDRLRGDVHTLTKQLKQLVGVENALVRSRAGRERQIGRIKRLARFALDIAGMIDPEDVLSQARRMLLEQFELDDVAAVHFDDIQPVVAIRGGNTLLLDHEVWTPLKAIRDVAISSARAPLAAAILANIGKLGVGRTTAARTAMWIPVRPNVGDLVLLCGWTSRAISRTSAPPGRRGARRKTAVTSTHRDVLHPDYIPFLGLFGEHVTRALDSAETTSALRRQGAELAESNRRLQTSLQELERTQAQLVQAQKLEALGRLASGIAHDFNNLLTVMVTHAHLIQPAVEMHREARSDLEVVVDAAMRAAEITQRLLVFSRKQENQQGAVDLNAVTIELSRMLQRWIGDDIVVALELDPSVGRVRADPADLEQIVTNLVVNARDAMPHGGTLTLETRHASGNDEPNGNLSATTPMIALTVRDSGIGMDEETCRQLFEPFFTTKPLGKGSGLGLATVYGLVTKNEGRIHVRSHVGEGSHFTVLLPSAGGLSGADLHARAATRGRVLIVEDEAAIRRMACRVLRKADFEVIEACDGDEALRIAQRLPGLDLLVTDVAMPAMTGPELATRIREFVPRLRVVFMSGFTFDRLDVTSLDTSVEQFLAKPFTPDQLQGAVEIAFSG